MKENLRKNRRILILNKMDQISYQKLENIAMRMMVKRSKKESAIGLPLKFQRKINANI
jgi:GTPase involved in cell partitioning and DNA repair